VGNPHPSPHPAAGACRGRCPPGTARWVGPEASNCAARCGPIGFHSGLRTDRRTAGLLCHVMGRTPSARLHALGAVPGRQRDEEIAAVGRTLCVHRACREHERRPVPGQGRTAARVSAGRCPDRAGLPHESSLCYGPRAAEAGPGGGPGRSKSARASLPSSPGHGPCQSGRRWGTDGPVAFTSRSAGRGMGRGRTTRTTAPPRPRTGRHGRPGPDRTWARQV
jgi:hypothetical protein